MADEGVGKSSEAESQPLRSTVAGSSQPVFISYASQDAAVAQKVCSALEAAGFPCWIAPRNIVPGTLYADGIVHAIDESSILVLILSAQAIASAHVGREIERAVSKRHPVVALRIDAAPLTAAFEYFLNQSQWIEGAGSDAAIAQLVSAVGQHLASGDATSATKAQQASAVHRQAAPPRRNWIIAIVVAVALAGGYFLVGKAWHSKHESTTSTAVISDKSIAVLPFTDMSEKKDQEYFADGMAEEIIGLLVKIRGLKVIGRTSSFQFKGKSEDLRSIGTKLGVAYVLEGSVRKSGDKLRVIAQLIDSRDGTQVLARSYDRDMVDVLKMQDEIAVQVVRALQIEVTASDFASRGALRDSGAYTAYLKGVHAFNRLDQQGVEQANSDFQRALDLNPQFADARVWLAITYLTLGAFGFISPAIANEQIRRSAELALKLDPNIATAHTLLGLVDLDDGNWAAADRELQLARALAPRNVGVVVLAGAQAEFMGHWDEVLKQANARLELDPLDPIGYRALSAVQLRRGRLAEAEAAARRALEISPTYAFMHYLLGVVLLARGEPDAALKEFAKEPLDWAGLKGSAMAYFALGRRADSDAALAEWLEKYPPTIRYPFALAEVYAFRHQSDEALKSLEDAYEKRDVSLPNPNAFPLLDSLHGDPRYKAFLKKMNLPE